MAHRLTNDNHDLYIDGVFEATDFNAIIDRYKEMMSGFDFTPRGERGMLINAVLFNDLKNQVINYAANNNYTKPQILLNTHTLSNGEDTSPNHTIGPQLWGDVSIDARPDDTIYEYSDPGTYSLSVPKGTQFVRIYYLIGSGGAGGIGWNQEWNEIGGSGGAGAYVMNIDIPIKYGDALSITIGSGGINQSPFTSNPNIATLNLKNVGQQPTNGGDSKLSISGSTDGNILCGGGKRGGSTMFVADDYYSLEDGNRTQKCYFGGKVYQKSDNVQVKRDENSLDNCMKDPTKNTKYGRGGQGGIISMTFNPSSGTSYGNGSDGMNGYTNGAHKNLMGTKGADSCLGTTGGIPIWCNSDDSTLPYDPSNIPSGNNNKGYGGSGSKGGGGAGSGVRDSVNSDNVCWLGGNGGHGYCKLRFF